MQSVMPLLRAGAFALGLMFAAPVMALPADAPSSFADLVEKLSPAVVNVSTAQKIKGAAAAPNMFGTPFQDRSVRVLSSMPAAISLQITM